MEKFSRKMGMGRCREREREKEKERGVGRVEISRPEGPS